MDLSAVIEMFCISCCLYPYIKYSNHNKNKLIKAVSKERTRNPQVAKQQNFKARVLRAHRSNAPRVLMYIPLRYGGCGLWLEC